MKLEADACDKCGGVPDGDRIDSITFYRCGHAICSNCAASQRRKHPEVQFPRAWCPTCDKVVDTPYAR